MQYAIQKYHFTITKRLDVRVIRSIVHKIDQNDALSLTTLLDIVLCIKREMNECETEL